ncbi:MAG: 3-oxoacyl-[acyl-carrier-protein] synthase III C-terminal domain-containing protein [Scytonema sp. PMC 1069.18]|nr:3-oxoacyl-[acyl-carrier-protein] synthase III C-terminal domain-containing protein [Scytonema sp. PMC 1069.18]MEC4883329.1 3-oxoacyl-[acyl-carrier-protein] synthase III C-terminal domain-containing protein [Scytonema sp. PMC 1070.18]
MKFDAVGIQAIALNFPSIIRTNDYYRENYPELVAKAEQKTLAKLFVPDNDEDIWSQEVAPYMTDPFRGTVERRVVAPEETSLTLEYRAAIDALEAAKLSPDDIDLMLVTSLFPEQVTPGNAAFLAGKLGLKGAAWNVESTCTSALVSLQTACALVKTGQYRNVLVVVSTTYSRYTDENDTLAFLSGDGAGAFIVGELKPNQGILGTKIANTSATCGAFYNEFTTDEHGNVKMFIRGGKGASRMFNETTVKFIHLCCHGAIADAGLTLEQINFFVFNTPSAWYSKVCTRALGIDPERTINLNPLYANIGPTFPVANLYHAAYARKIQENDLVLVYTMGSSSNAGASVMRWGDVALGPAPASPVSFSLEKAEILVPC